ncbi:hypothetical protein KIPB_010787, partial [Kipferlia bialata]|eukprot:g10787.t1
MPQSKEPLVKREGSSPERDAAEREREGEKGSSVPQSTFNLTNSVLGAGILSLSYAMAN